MSGKTAVNTAALRGAAATASRLSEDVLSTSVAASPVVTGLASELSGARSSVEVTAVRQATDGVLSDLGCSLSRLTRVLSAAASHYAEAEGNAAGAAASAAPRARRLIQ